MTFKALKLRSLLEQKRAYLLVELLQSFTLVYLGLVDSIRLVQLPSSLRTIENPAPHFPSGISNTSSPAGLHPPKAQAMRGMLERFSPTLTFSRPGTFAPYLDSVGCIRSELNLGVWCERSG